jgi:hypothetical protein
MQNKQKTPWILVRKRNIPTERLQLLGEFLCQLLLIGECLVVSLAEIPRPLISVLQTEAANFSFM